MGWILFLLLIGAIAVAPLVVESRRLPMDQAERTNAPGQFANLSLGQTHYDWSGHIDGPVAVCVHGLTSPSFVWSAVVKVLTLMGFRILTYDLYGRGFSDRPKGAQNTDFFVNQLTELMDDQEVGENVTLLGYSMGGAIATAYAARHRDRLERLVLIAPGGLGHDLGKFFEFAANTPLIGDWLFLMFGGLVHRRNISKEAAAWPTEVPDIHEDQANETHFQGFLPAVLSSMRHMLGKDQEPEHRAIAKTDLPVLAIWGEEDDVIPISGLGRLAEFHRDARQVSIPGAPHALAYTHPKDVQKALQDLLHDGL